MKTVNRFITQAPKWFMAALLLPAFSACDDLIYDDGEECYYVEIVNEVQSANFVRFSYDYNIKFADAFHNEVKQVKLFVFDRNGNYIKTLTEDADVIIARGNLMKIGDEDLQPGEYIFQAWAACDNGFNHFELKQGDTLEDFECMLKREHDDNGQAFRNTDCGRLFHCLNTKASLGTASSGSTVTEPELRSLDDIIRQYGKDFVIQGDKAVYTHSAVKGDTIPMQMVKNTNTFHIALQQADGSALDANEFDIRITDQENGWLAYDNRPKDTETIHYLPWDIRQTAIDDANPDGRATAAGLVADLSTARLMVDEADRKRLIVRTRTDGREILNLPLIDVLLLVKGNYTNPRTGEKLTDQEYLDRQDDYSLVFFLTKDENGGGKQWLSTHIYINSWHVVLQSTDL